MNEIIYHYYHCYVCVCECVASEVTLLFIVDLKLIHGTHVSIQFIHRADRRLEITELHDGLRTSYKTQEEDKQVDSVVSEGVGCHGLGCLVAGAD